MIILYVRRKQMKPISTALCLIFLASILNAKEIRIETLLDSDQVVVIGELKAQKFPTILIQDTEQPLSSKVFFKGKIKVEKILYVQDDAWARQIKIELIERYYSPTVIFEAISRFYEVYPHPTDGSNRRFEWPEQIKDGKIALVMRRSQDFSNVVYIIDDAYPLNEDDTVIAIGENNFMESNQSGDGNSE